MFLVNLHQQDTLINMTLQVILDPEFISDKKYTALTCIKLRQFVVYTVNYSEASFAQTCTVSVSMVKAKQYYLVALLIHVQLQWSQSSPIEYFFVHTMNISENDVVEQQFAVVNWPKEHPRWFNRIGKPYEPRYLWWEQYCACCFCFASRVLVTVPLVL